MDTCGQLNSQYAPSGNDVDDGDNGNDAEADCNRSDEVLACASSTAVVTVTDIEDV